MMYLPRLCEHCLNPACVASCPIGSIYKREEDGIVLIDQDKCRGWRMCVSGCPTRRSTTTGRPARPKVHLLLSPHRSRQPTVCSETCVGRIRYLGVLLYDADRIQAAASVEHDRDLYQAQLDLFLDPNDPRSSSRLARMASPKLADGRQEQPVYKMAVDWKVALPCTPNTAPCPWSGMCRRCRPSSRRPVRSHRCQWRDPLTSTSCAFPVKVPGQPADRGDTIPVVPARWSACWPCALHARQACRWCQNQKVLAQVGLDKQARSRTCTT